MSEPGLFSDGVERHIRDLLEVVPAQLSPSSQDATTARVAVRRLHSNGAVSGEEWIGDAHEFEGIVGLLSAGDVAVLVLSASAACDTTSDEGPF